MKRLIFFPLALVFSLAPRSILAPPLGSVPRPTPRDIVRSVAYSHGVDPDFAEQLAWEESRFDPQAHGSDGVSLGLMQLNQRYHPLLHPFEPWENAEAGMVVLAEYLAQCGGDRRCAVHAYRSGKVLARRPKKTRPPA